VWDPSKVKLHLSPNQEGDKRIGGNDLRKELEILPVYNANLLDYLLKNPHLIPEDWKVDKNGNRRYIFFWGTIYADSGGDLCVRCLFWYDSGWYWDSYWLGRDWGSRYPAALASN
jgi:hypothetical protein